ncbi:MAG: putative flavodoxin [Pelosinus sp.]|jgi:flavodoxin|nr:putative flavodoxin [Pelosinus sp.]
MANNKSENNQVTVKKVNQKRIITAIVIVILVAVTTLLAVYITNKEKGSAIPNNSSANMQTPPKTARNTLVAYLTRTGNTEAVAKMIHDEVGGGLVKLELETPYPDNYQKQVAQVEQEDESGYLPPLKTSIDKIDSYDTIFVGFPTWNMQLPPPIRSFLNKYNLSGKTVIPFNTNGGYGVGSGFEEFKKLCADSIVPEGFSVEGGRERDGILFVMNGDKEIKVRSQVHAWLEHIGLL